MRQKELILAAALFAAIAVPATARATLRFAGIDGITSTVMQQNQSSISGVALRARVKADSLAPALAFLPTIEYWRSRSRVDSYAIRSTRTDATLGLDARWEFKTGNVRPYLGGGFAMHFLSSEVSSTQLGLHETSSTLKGGLAALGGVSLAIAGRLDNFFEAKYHHIPGYSQVKLNWGLSVSW
jgi:hypothetical protein